MATGPQQALADLFPYLLTILLPDLGKLFSLQSEKKIVTFTPKVFKKKKKAWWLEVQFNGILEGENELQDISLNSSQLMFFGLL